MAKTRSHTAEVAERINWLLCEASNQHNGTGGEREHVIVSGIGWPADKRLPEALPCDPLREPFSGRTR
jgi:hypothetical protein